MTSRNAISNVNRGMTAHTFKNFLTAEVADDDCSAMVRSESSMSTAHSRGERAPDAFAIGSHPRRETSTSNIVSYCGPSERALQAAQRAPLCTRTRCTQRASYEYLNVALDTNYQLRSMDSTSRCTLISKAFLQCFNRISLNSSYECA